MEHRQDPTEPRQRRGTEDQAPGRPGPRRFFFKVFLNDREEFREFDVERCLPYKNSHLLKLKGIDSLAAADALAGREVFVPEDALQRPGDDRIYDFDLIGCGVVTPDGGPVGMVKDVMDLGESTLLVVEGPPGPREVLIPLSREICVEIDLVGRRIVVDPPDGLFDLNEI